MGDSYFTIKQKGEGQLREKMSRFLAFAHKIASAEEAKSIVKAYQNEYHDSRHVCWAYMLGADRQEWQLNDNGEPSGTAGKPILGQINSRQLTDVVVVVVRYFGGIKLGTPGLISAYREAASLALDDAGIEEMHKQQTVEVTFPYMAADGVMRIVKSYDIEVLERKFDNTCSMTLRMREDDFEEITGKIGGVSGTSLRNID
ncbi:MAG: IMPACT family protein [Muribaculaceae bacterium]